MVDSGGRLGGGGVTRGDLVTIQDTDDGETEIPVVVLGDVPGRESLVTLPNGTLAVFLEELHEDLWLEGREKKALVLVEGVVGWVYMTEVEPVT